MMDFPSLFYIIEPYINAKYLIIISVLAILQKVLCQTRFSSNSTVIITLSAIFLSGVYAFASNPIETLQQCLLALFVSLTQGLLIAGINLYCKPVVCGCGKGLKWYYDIVKTRKSGANRDTIASDSNMSITQSLEINALSNSPFKKRKAKIIIVRNFKKKGAKKHRI